ncbi:MAG: hypothetical protein ABSH00_07045 [Bryobacteraceae bacterium]
MTTLAQLTWQGAVAGRWVARIGGTLMVLFLLAFLAGEGFPPLAQMTTREQFYALGFGSLFVGLVVAWFREGWGGLLSVLGWTFLAVVARRPAWDLPFSIPAAIGLLHLVCWWRLRGPAPWLEPRSAAAVTRFRLLYVVLWVSLAAFILLCANEMFGNPPLMTRSGQPAAEMVGTWSAALTTVSGRPLPHEIPAVLAIGPDGSVAGEIGGAELISGRLLRSRSWFGRLMNWRTDYVIRGTLSRVVESYGGTAGDHFSAPVSFSAQELAGSLFLSHPGAPKPLGLRLRRR